MVSRRHALKLSAGAAAVVATGGAAFVWLNKEEDGSTETDSGSPLADAVGGATSPTSPPHGEQASIQTEVSDDGFALVLGSVRVMAPAGVAPAGTRISVSATAPSGLQDLENFVRASGDPIDIVLSDGQQPQQPITIEFTIDPNRLSADVSAEFPLVVMTTSQQEDVPGYLEGTWNAETSVLTVVTDHLSPFEWLQFDLGKWFSDFLDRLLGLTFSKPACAYQPGQFEGTTYWIDAIDDDAIWPCIEERSGQIVVGLHSNSVLPWAVKSRPSVRGTVSGSWKDMGPGLAKFYQGLYALMGDERTAVMPGNAASLTFNASAPPEVIGLKIDTGLFLVSTLLYAVQSTLSIFFRGKPIADELLDGFEGLDCILEIQNTFYEFEDEGSLTGVVKSALSCILAMMGENLRETAWAFISKAVLTVMNLLIGGASLIAAGLLGAYRTATSNDEITFTISSGNAAVVPSPLGTGSSVPTFRGNPAGTGEMPGPAPRLDTPIEILWEHRVRSSHIHPPVYADGVVYASSYPSAVQAIAAGTGEQLWRMTFDGNVEASPAVFDGTVYVCSADSRNYANDSTVHALDASSGTEKWRFMPDQEVVFAPCLWEGIVFVTSRWHLIHALDASSGRVIWSRNTLGQFDNSPTVSNGIVYAGGKGEGIDPEGAIWAFDAYTGNEQWMQQGRRWVTSTPVVRHGMVYVSCGDDYLYALDAESGSEEWRFLDGGAIRNTSPAVNEHVVVTTGPDGALFGLDLATGAERWSTASDLFFMDATPVIVDGTVFVPGKHDSLFAFDSASGEELWRFPIHHPKSPVVTDGRIFVPGRDTLYALGNPTSAFGPAGVTVASWIGRGKKGT